MAEHSLRTPFLSLSYRQAAPIKTALFSSNCRQLITNCRWFTLQPLSVTLPQAQCHGRQSLVLNVN